MALRTEHSLHNAVEYLKGVGPLRGELLRKELGIATWGDMLYHFPFRYIDSGQVQPIGTINVSQEYVQLQGTLSHLKEEGSAFKKRLSVYLQDNSGQVELIWFQGISYVSKQLRPQTIYKVFGKVSWFNGMPTLTHPEIEELRPGSATRNLQPVYSSTEKLKNKGLGNRAMAKVVQSMLEQISVADLPEILPPSIRERYGLMPRWEAFRNIHMPSDNDLLQQAIKRLKWEELIIAQMKIARLKLNHQRQEGFRFPSVGRHFNEFFNHYLPFSLTGAQKRVIKEIRQDTFNGGQMNRLVQGDVGSGKTIVALMAMLLAIDNGFQASLMAPTEILSQQHYQSIKGLLEPMGLRVGLLTGSVKGKERKALLAGLADGSLSLVIGTHALVEETVRFHNLGMAIIDEQHRFGVTQRAKLWSKNHKPPHVLVMTATPIPRTLAMTIYGDLEVSVIDELPPGRKPIDTVHRSEGFRPQVMQFIRNEIAMGRQIYIVYPLIEESEKIDYESLKSGYEQVKAWFPDPAYRVAMVHGKQPMDERERNMKRFVEGDAHILVATTVIEVGVNVPNASVMIIESAERFGLSQLHQLRGRVGRGSEKSYCILLTSSEISKESRKRMHIMTQTSDGFLIAEEDLKMRGPGDIYGTRQSGPLDFKIADIVNDHHLMAETKEAATRILSEDPYLEQGQYQPLKRLLQSDRKHAQPWSKIS